MSQPTESPLLVVYTALFGDYEALVEQPIAAASGAKFVCFTDNPSLQSETWEIRLTEPTLPWDTTRAARKAKITGYQAFSEAAATIWIDNRIVLRAAPEDIVATHLAEHEMAVPLHSFRRSVRDEFREVLAAGFDTPWRVREQQHSMELHAAKILDEVPYWTAILIRRPSAKVDRAMEIWLDHVLRHSRRDQLSVNYAIDAACLPVNALKIDNLQSELHDWLRVDRLPKRKDVLFSRGYTYSLRQHARDAAATNRWSIAVRTRLLKLAARVRALGSGRL